MGQDIFVRYNLVFVHNRVRYNRVSLYLTNLIFFLLHDLRYENWHITISLHFVFVTKVCSGWIWLQLPQRHRVDLHAPGSLWEIRLQRLGLPEASHLRSHEGARILRKFCSEVQVRIPVSFYAVLMMRLKVRKYSQTWANDHFSTTTTCQ